MNWFFSFFTSCTENMIVWFCYWSGNSQKSEHNRGFVPKESPKKQLLWYCCQGECTVFYCIAYICCRYALRFKKIQVFWDVVLCLGSVGPPSKIHPPKNAIQYCHGKSSFKQDLAMQTAIVGVNLAVCAGTLYLIVIKMFTSCCRT